MATPKIKNRRGREEAGPRLEHAPTYPREVAREEPGELGVERALGPLALRPAGSPRRASDSKGLLRRTRSSHGTLGGIGKKLLLRWFAEGRCFVGALEVGRCHVKTEEAAAAGCWWCLVEASFLVGGDSERPGMATAAMAGQSAETKEVSCPGKRSSGQQLSLHKGQTTLASFLSQRRRFASFVITSLLPNTDAQFF